MKNGKKLSVAQYKHLQLLGIKSEEWLLSKKTTKNWLLVHRETGMLYEIPSPKESNL